MMTAMGAGAAATGTRSYIAARHFSWVTPGRLRRLTAALLAGALLASGLLVSGSGAPPPSRSHSSPRQPSGASAPASTNPS